MKKKVLILLPDGVGLRNFAFTHFYEKMKKNHDVVFWNNTAFKLNEKLGVNEIVFKGGKTHFFTEILKTSKNVIELKLSSKKFNDKTYLSYLFPKKITKLKSLIKNGLIHLFIVLYKSETGVEKIQNIINKVERRTLSYKYSVEELKNIKPSFVFCTNQRTSSAIAPILAAKDLNIPTSSFIFSWDNLPKATLVVASDYYFVWSNYMKKELQTYYPYIQDNQIKITGTPQFEPHFDENLFETREYFFKKHDLDLDKEYVCFSGDDITTSPYDQYYLEDLAKSIAELNKEGNNLGVIYRKCPVDFSNRHLEIIKKYNDIIKCIDPIWSNLGNSWNNCMPQKEDLQLLVNTVKHSRLIVNIGSSMVFDAVSHNIPCAYINYNTEQGDKSKWNIDKIYKFIHFKSMPSKKAVLWIDNKDDYKVIIEKILKNEVSLSETRDWFDKIALSPQTNASRNIVKEINTILNGCI
jgi:hypothetical protein